MISLISAISLRTAELGICIAVFAALIIAEIVTLIFLVRWKNNYHKPSKARIKATEKAKARRQAHHAHHHGHKHDEVTQADGLVSQGNAENTSAVEEPAQAPQEQSEEGIVMQSEETQQTVEETQGVEETEEVAEATAEDEQEVAVAEETAEEDAKPNDKLSAFAFAPLSLLAATAPITALRYVLYALIGVSVALAIAVFTTAIIFAKSLSKSKKEEQPAQTPIIDDNEQKPQEEQQPTTEIEGVAQEEEEQVAEDELTAEEEPVEETAQEEEELIEEQPVEEEEPVEEVEEEQPIAEEPEVEELVADEEPVAEEAPAEEEKPIREETVFVVEKPISMFVKPKLAPEKKDEKVRERVVVIDNVTYTMRDDRYLFNPAENDWYIVLTKTFTAKLIQSEDYVKDYYTELKNELLSYKKVHSRMSKKRESFNYGRVCLARLSIRGKTLRLHLALDANNYVDTKYIVEDTSNVKSLADTPLMYRIKNDRRLKYAKDLIAAVMAQVGAVKQEIEPVDYTAMYPYEETEPLIERGLITRKWYQGKVPEDKGFDFAKKTFKAKLIQSDDVVKEYYSQLKNHLLSYRKIHERMSKARESFRFGRICVARMAIRGKTLKLALALNPQDYVDTKYKFDDNSDVKSLADTPLVMRIKNPRRLKYALELIDVVMANVGTTLKRDIDELDYTTDLAFESTEELMDKGLVVNVHVSSNSFVAQHFSLKKPADDEAAADEDDEA